MIAQYVSHVHRAASCWGEALIALASAFTYDEAEDTVSCDHCWCFMWAGCAPTCPGLLARRALGIA